MKAKGFAFLELPPDALYADGPQAQMPAADFAGKYGFGFLSLGGSRAPAPKADDPNLAVISKLSVAGQQAWTAAAGACEQQADADVTLFADAIAVRAAAAELRSRIASDSRVLKAESTWQDCMRVAGLEVSTRQQMLADLRDAASELLAAGADDEQSSRHADFLNQKNREIALARADQSCHKPLLATERLVIKEHQEEFLSSHEEQLGD